LLTLSVDFISETIRDGDDVCFKLDQHA